MCACFSSLKIFACLLGLPAPPLLSPLTLSSTTCLLWLWTLPKYWLGLCTFGLFPVDTVINSWTTQLLDHTCPPRIKPQAHLAPLSRMFVNNHIHGWEAGWFLWFCLMVIYLHFLSISCWLLPIFQRFSLPLGGIWFPRSTSKAHTPSL